MPLIPVNGAASLQTRPRLKREHGEADPKGTETVAAPATVSGEWACIMPLVYNREGAGQQRPASQETCHSHVQPQRTGCSDGNKTAESQPKGLALSISGLFSGQKAQFQYPATAGQGACVSCNAQGAALRVEALCYAPRNSRQLINTIDFSITPGERLAIIGPNGAGKTTLLRCLYGAITPTQGRVVLDNQDIRHLSQLDIARRIAVVVQEMPAGFPFTVEDVVMTGRIPWRKGLATNRAKDRAEAYHAMEHLNLQDMGNRLYGTLSGGEKQRVLVARALAQSPQLLILDEPSNHLDIRNQLEILDLLAGLGITIITTLHDINLAAGFATKAAILHDGQLIAFGTAAEVLTPEHIARAFDVKTRAHAIEDSAGQHFSFTLNA